MTASHRVRNVTFIVVGFIVVAMLVLVLARGCGERRREAARDRISTAVAARTTGQARSGAQGWSDSAAEAGAAPGSSASDGQAPSNSSGDQAGDSGSADADGGDSGDSEWVDTVEGPPADGDNQLAPPQEPPPDNGGDGIVVVGDSQPLEIVRQNVTSFRGPPGGIRAFFAAVRGNAVSVTMSISGPGGAFTVSLTGGPLIDGATNWSVEANGPSIPGQYSYSTTAVGADGTSVTAEGSYFIVE